MAHLQGQAVWPHVLGSNAHKGKPAVLPLLAAAAALLHILPVAATVCQQRLQKQLLLLVADSRPAHTSG
jgi:hypothetical protein